MSESDASDRKRKFKKQFYGGSQGAKKRKLTALQVGDKGFLVTCGNGNESKAIREAYDLLNEYADNLYGAEDKEDKDDKSDAKKADDDEEDIEVALKEECSRMTSKDQLSSPHRFLAVDCGVKNCCFIKSTLNDKPSTLAYEILSDLKRKSVQKCRFLQRLLPIDFTCRTSEKEFMEAAKVLVDIEFASTKEDVQSPPLTYAIQFKTRHSNIVSREMSFRIIGDLIVVTNPNTKVDLTKPEKTVLVEILGKICCLSVAREYQELHRYNVHEVVNPSPSLAPK